MRIVLSVVVCLASFVALTPSLGAQTTRPRLVVLLVVDQMRADYIELFRHQWTAGFPRLLREGAWFSQASYPFASTTTCSGHASVSTGTLPAVHGMVMNVWWDRDFGRAVACADDPTSLALSYGKPVSGPGQSAIRLLAPTLADEMRAQLTPSPRVAAFSLKARSAVTLAGQQPDVVAWAADEGAWVTSTRYPQGLSPEVGRFVSANPVEHQLWTTWNRALPMNAYRYPATAAGLRDDLDSSSFPHPIRTWGDWETSPLSDEYLGRMALSVATDLHFGTTSATDFLAVSFSALDLVGHIYGPNSHEVQDVLVRLDRTIGALLTGLDRLVGRGNYVVALTADHGVAPTTAWAMQQGVGGGRIPARAIPDAAQKAITALLGPGRWVSRLLNGELYLENGASSALRATPGAIDAVKEALRSVPGVEQVYVAEDMAPGRHGASNSATLGAASHMPARSGDFSIVYAPYWLVGQPGGANHGTPHPYDRHVPVILSGRGIRRGEQTRTATPLDIAPTLASLIGVRMPHAQGRVLVEVLPPH